MLNIFNLFFWHKKQQFEAENNQHSYDVENTFDGLDIESAIQAHLDWKAKLEKAIEQHSIGHYDVKTVSEDNHCLLGKWIHNQAKQLYGHSEVYRLLKMSHLQFHKISGEILVDIRNENFEIAKIKVQRHLSRSSDSVQLDLIRLCTEAI